MKKKKLLAVLCAASLAAGMCGCGTASTSSASGDDSADSITGKVTAVDGTSVTLKLGELSDSQPEGGQTPPDNSGADTGSGTAPSAGDNSSSDNGGQTPPEKPEGNGGNADSGSGQPSDNGGQTPPEKPEGDSGNADSGSGQPSDNGGQTPPEMPSGSGEAPSGSGEAPSGDAGEMPKMQSFTEGEETKTVDLGDTEITDEMAKDDTELTADDLEKGDIITITYGDDGNIESITMVHTGDEMMNGGGNGAGGGSQDVEQGTSASTIKKDKTVKNKTYTSDGDDENALRVDGASVKLTGITVNKKGGKSSNAETGDFYGMNAGLLATNGAEVTIKNADVKTSAQNGNGVFSYGEGTTVTISDSTIHTTKDNSGGIQTTGGGTTKAKNLTVETEGASAAAIRSDRGGGTVTVKGGTYTSNGLNSPAVYSTADISVSGAELTANNSEALVIEGKNSIKLKNCDVTGNMSDTKGGSSDENVHNVMIYQSMSGDADEGTSTFSMNGGSLTSKNGDMFYITNTAAEIDLTNVTLKNQDKDGNLFTISGNSASKGWGTAGSNGAQVTLNCSNQELDGDISVDSISTLNLTLSDGSSMKGTVNITDNAEGGDAADSNAVVTIEKGCTWTLTGDCTVTSLRNSGTINYNGHTITLADGTVKSE